MDNKDFSKRLAAFEAMLCSVQTQYCDTTARLQGLKAAGREKTATYRQLLGNKLQLQAMLSLYQIHGLIDKMPAKKEEV